MEVGFGKSAAESQMSAFHDSLCRIRLYIDYRKRICSVFVHAALTMARVREHGT